MVSIPAVIGACRRQRDQRRSTRKRDSMHHFHVRPLSKSAENHAF
jgi:hypothetical protein